MNLQLIPYRPERDAYRLLGVAPTASDQEIQAACRRLVRAFHPDRNASPRATMEMQVVNAVRRVMTDPSLRAAYDRERGRWHRLAADPRPAVDPWPPGGPGDLVDPRPVRLLPGPRRYVGAAFAGLRATVSSLVPSRCRRCRMVLADGDAYCLACGVRVA